MTNISRNSARWAACAIPVVAVWGLLVATVGQVQTSALAKLPSALAQTASTPAAEKLVAYSAVGPYLTQYDVNVANGTLTPRGTVTLPDNVVEAWTHPSRKYLYVGWSNGFGQPGNPPHNGISAFSIDAASGALRPLGKPLFHPQRAIFLTVDGRGQYLLAAFPHPPERLLVHKIGVDGTLGAEVKPEGTLDIPIWPHQVRIDPTSSMVLLPGRGGDDEPGEKPRGDPGALKVFSFKDGVLSNLQSIAPNGGYGFHPRHLEFHPTLPFVYLNQERIPRLFVYKKMGDGTLSPEPVFSVDPLEKFDPKIDQGLGETHLHPNGRFLYLANRASGAITFEGKRDVFAGGENTIVVYSINQTTGEPTLIQRIDTRGYSPHTFAVDTAGQFVVVGNMNPRHVRGEGGLRAVPASVALFRIKNDATLEFTSKFDLPEDPNGGLQRWVTLVRLPSAQPGT